MTEARRVYQLSNLSLDELNFLLSQISERLDQMEGFRGSPHFRATVDMGGNKGINAAPGTQEFDLMTFQQIFPVDSLFWSSSETNPGSVLGGTWQKQGVFEAPTTTSTRIEVWLFRRIA